MSRMQEDIDDGFDPSAARHDWRLNAPPEPVVSVVPSDNGQKETPFSYEEAGNAYADERRAEALREVQDDTYESLNATEDLYLGESTDEAVEYSGTGEHADEAAQEQPQAMVSPNEDLIGELLDYVDDEFRDSERERLIRFDRKQLETVLGTMRDMVGPSCDTVRALNLLFTTRMADPVHRTIQAGFERSAHAYDRLTSEVARAVGDELLVNALANGDFRQAARDNVNALSVLSAQVQKMEAPLRRYLRWPPPSHEDLVLPVSLARMLNVLRHATAHLDAAHSLTMSLEERLREERFYNEKLRERLRERTEEVEGLRDAVSFDGPKFLRDGKKGSFLANHAAPSGKLPPRLPLHRMHWTASSDHALKFASEEQALDVVQRWIDVTVRRLGTDDWDETLLGVSARDIVVAELCVRNS